MSFWLGRDFFNNPIVPPYILCKSNKERIGVITCTTKNITVNFNSLDEIQFDAYLYNDSEKNKFYDDINVMKYILLPDIGFYAITDVGIQSEGTNLEHKSVTAKSYECLLGQKYLETFTINMGTTESIDGVKLYNLGNPQKSLLHLVLEKCPDWTIGHIDVSLRSMERSFQVDRQDIYSFLTTDVSEAFNCIFVFDTLNNVINVYTEENFGKDTNIYVSYNNLLKSADISCNVDDIKTCITLTGADDLNIRDINMGYDRIYNLEYYNSTEYMSKSLYDAWNAWVKKRNENLDTYTSLLSQYEDYYIQINELTHLKMPSNPESTNWSEYGLVPLQEKLATYEQQQSVMMKSGWGDKDNSNYTTKYLPIYNTINKIKAQITIVEKQLSTLKNAQTKIYNQMSSIIDSVSMENNFTQGQLKELTSFIREEELSSDNFVVTDSMTDEERFDMLHEFLDYGEKELVKVATPQLSFNADMVNLFALPEFEIWNEDFAPGNYLHVSLRDNYLVKARLLSVSVNFMDVTDFNVTFGNVIKNGDKLFDIAEAIAQAQSAATSVSFNASYWNKSSKDTSDIGKMLDEGLLSAGKYLKSGDDSEMVIDSRGIFVNTTSGTYANKDSIFIGGGRILFTEDNWETVSMSVGRADVTIRGVTESKFGTFADFMVAGYIGGSLIEGDEIIGGTITGTVFNNGNGTFLVDENGNLTATSATVKGTIKADAGYIGGENGFTITAGKLYSGKKSSYSSTVDGIYIGTDGISFGANNTFLVTSKGKITAKSGTVGGWTIDDQKIFNNLEFDNDKSNNSTGMGKTDAVSNSAFWAGDGKYLVKNNGYLHAEYGDIGGATITNNSLHASNNNWWIGSDGSASFKNVYVSGVKSGSSFGSIGWDGSMNWGSFGGASYFGSTIGSPFSGTCVSHIQSISADHIKANYLDAMNAEIGSLWAETASIETLATNNFNANSARIDTLDTTVATINKAYITAATCESIISNTVTSDYINARLAQIGGLNLSGSLVVSENISCYGSMSVNGNEVATKQWVIDNFSQN